MAIQEFKANEQLRRFGKKQMPQNLFPVETKSKNFLLFF
jgi:hypothetical protein